MRTTLAIDDDVLAAAKGLAARQKKTVGQVVSELARQSLRPATASAKSRNGVPLLPVNAKAGPVTLEVVNALRDESA
ncbi:MAG: CopG family transcriptional regulator [Burkholderiales bacterium]